VLLNAAGLALLVVALAQPREIGDWIMPPPEGRDIALVVDTSLTMSIDDFEQNGGKATRLAVLKDVLTRLVAARPADRFAVIAFGAAAAMLTPPSFDRSHVAAQIARLQAGMAGDNTALGDALGLAIKHVRAQKLRPAIILVSDGEPSNTGDMTPAEAVAVARQLDIAIHTVQAGSDLFAAGRVAIPAAVPQDDEVQPDLADIARLTGGRHWKIASATDAAAMAVDIDRLEKTLAAPARYREVREWYLLPLLLAATLFAAARLLLIRREAAA
jgi:Ca-activated chloride channel family protein